MAILSLLFNWPSTGGGIVHTVELAEFLARAGYTVRHIYARHLNWGVGRVTEPAPHSRPIDFSDANWNPAGVRARFAEALREFAPDSVVVTDSWNAKPLLAEAATASGRRVYIRLAALECLCPLNNLRLLPGEPDRGGFRYCPRHQLATPDACRACVAAHGAFSGGLHQAERSLADWGTPDYDARLRRAFAEADAVLVLNRLAEAMVGPHARAVRVVPWGMDPARFPSPEPPPTRAVKTILFAGLASEAIKGLGVLRRACALLADRRRDFTVVVTDAKPAEWASHDVFRFVGWKSQAELPTLYREADVVVVPTVAPDGLSRTSVEAMAAGRAVVAARIGGLPETVSDGGTGLLFEPGDAADLAEKLARVLDDFEFRRRAGAEGRRRFDADFHWPTVIDRYYRPLLGEPVFAAPASTKSSLP